MWKVIIITWKVKIIIWKVTLNKVKSNNNYLESNNNYVKSKDNYLKSNIEQIEKWQKTCKKGSLTGINRRQIFPKYVGRYSNNEDGTGTLFDVKIPS